MNSILTIYDSNYNILYNLREIIVLKMNDFLKKIKVNNNYKFMPQINRLSP